MVLTAMGCWGAERGAGERQTKISTPLNGSTNRRQEWDDGLVEHAKVKGPFLGSPGGIRTVVLLMVAI